MKGMNKNKPVGQKTGKSHGSVMSGDDTAKSKGSRKAKKKGTH